LSVNVDEMFWNWMSRLLDNAQHWQRFALYECHLVFCRLLCIFSFFYFNYFALFSLWVPTLSVGMARTVETFCLFVCLSQ